MLTLQFYVKIDLVVRKKYTLVPTKSKSINASNLSLN